VPPQGTHVESQPRIVVVTNMVVVAIVPLAHVLGGLVKSGGPVDKGRVPDGGRAVLF
jgi:hypothetical protein